MTRLSADRWARVALGVSTAAAAYAAFDLASPLRVLVILAFLLLVPGTAIIRLLRLDELAAEVALATGLSVSLAGMVAGVLLYAGAWSPGATLAILICVTLAAVGVELEQAYGSVTRRAASLSELRRRATLRAPVAPASVVASLSALWSRFRSSRLR